jgi:predicted DNA-binding transcriptional regulator AlpA
MSDNFDSNPLRVFNKLAAVKLLGVSERTSDRLERDGNAPPKIQLSPRRVGYRASDLAAWLDARRRQTA